VFNKLARTFTGGANSRAEGGGGTRNHVGLEAQVCGRLDGRRNAVVGGETAEDERIYPLESQQPSRSALMKLELPDFSTTGSPRTSARRP
jgi:hypothetical protein